MRRVLCSLLLIALAMVSRFAVADPVLLSIQGTLDGGSMTGTLQVLDSGYFEPVDVTVLYNGTSYTFNGATSTGQIVKTDGSLGVYATSSTPNNDQLFLAFPVPLLLNYAGGPLCSLSDPCSATGDSYFAFNGLGIHRRALESATASVATAATPEPESLGLVGMGLVGLWAGLRGMKRRRAAV